MKKKTKVSDETTTLIGAGVIIVLVLLIGAFGVGYFMADGTPDVYHLEEQEANTIRIEEQQACKLLIKEKDVECKETINYFEEVIDGKDTTIENYSSLNNTAWEQVTILRIQIKDLNTTIVDLNKTTSDLNC